MLYGRRLLPVLEEAVEGKYKLAYAHLRTQMAWEWDYTIRVHAQAEAARRAAELAAARVDRYVRCLKMSQDSADPLR